MPIEFDQYSTAKPLGGGAPSWVRGLDARRLSSYLLYEMIYWNVPESFRLVQRGSDTKPIYVPTGRQIIETMHRFLATDFKVETDPDLGKAPDRKAADHLMTAFFRREKLASRFSMAKRYGLIRGDWVFMIRADPDRDAGSRLSLYPIDPGSYFPITAEDDVDTVIGCHIVEQIDYQRRPRIYRTTYRKTNERGGPSPISVEEAIFEIDEWGGPEMDDNKTKKVVQIRPPELLPEPINSLPVYHIQNFSEPGSPYGSSEMRGLERMVTAINQAISDEELAVIMEGLGVYVTDAGAPIDEATGETKPWNLGPGKVIELPGTDKRFMRVDGLKMLDPFQDHLKYLHDQLDLSAGMPAIAKGSVDVLVAESGIALALQMGPILARADEKLHIITDVWTNLLFDLRNWFSAYENEDIGDAQWIPHFGDALPVNRKQRFDEILALYALTPAVISAQWVRDELAKIGFDFPNHTDMMSQILDEQTMIGQVQADIVGSRIDQALAAQPPVPGAPPVAPGTAPGTMPAGMNGAAGGA